MTNIRGRLLRAILTIFLFPISFCFATTRFVNINNPTPGLGTSWTTAFNNLQSALAASGIFDKILVAQGTYRPSTPAGRSATFLIPAYVSVYGGFNGTEPDETTRNPTLYPTILSGDIGVVGDPSDNCYHVVSVNNNGQSSLFSLTISDGHADAGYPASSVPQPDNMGGGVLVNGASAGAVSSIVVYNCIYTNNYAVYGGGLGAYGNAAIETNWGCFACLFYNNQAVDGGAGACFSDNSNQELGNFESCIFNNNTASAGNSSVFSSSISNASTSYSEINQIYNCLLYNEATPMMSNQLNSAHCSYTFMNNIIWTPGSPYTGGYTTGNTPINFDHCDVDGTLPPGSNIDADPQFINTAGGNFHVPPCSPVVDAGYNWAEYVNDYDGNLRQQGVVDIGPFEQVKGTASAEPSATTPQTFCQNSTAAITISGTSLMWYTSATGGTGSSTTPTISTASPGSTDYFVTQTTGGMCESNRLYITVTIIKQPANPSVNPVLPYCQYTTAAPLTAGGAGLRWYPTATGGTGDPTTPTPSTATIGPAIWYVSQTAGNCESPRTSISITVKATPAIAIDPINGSVCLGGTVKLQAQGADSYQWSPATGLSDPSISDPVAQLQSNILYTVTGTTDGCSATAQVTLQVGTNCTGGTGGYYIPNAFSPNGDGANDLFRVKTGDVPRSFNMTVFNRYGGKIFESADVGTGWDGVIGGNLAPTGTYVYLVVLTTSSGEIIKKQGTVILVR